MFQYCNDTNNRPCKEQCGRTEHDGKKRAQEKRRGGYGNIHIHDPSMATPNVPWSGARSQINRNRSA